MVMTGNTVLITGGSAGIGFALAREFLTAGNEVIVCGRSERKLAQAKEQLPALHTRVSDVSDEQQRQELYNWTIESFPAVNVLVNNAGIQQRLNLQKTSEVWNHYHREIEANLEGPIHLTMLFLPHLLQQSRATVVNVTSGLAITPAAFAPIYSATKAALHSFSISLRVQLQDTPVDVVDILPPAVNTDLGGPGLHTFGADVNEFATAVFQKMDNGELEIGFGDSDRRLKASNEELKQAPKQMWERFKSNNPAF
ncbi:SDR family oxidoreductase [Alicyclobacillus sp. SO9]|uniref:SDR family oxidoreductase n=1 Tax=Alicyclobacillus sp. SO9 TaxID=2665646 RepID=UPI0018E8E0FD|nr:SDR family NAD(P)-dependent oxidoreductase [Alicyclobacillus sp. SO9]QQE78273.1 SDR family NAD(P)-dependent oxidoreductase [Alicyclobacillus sp. SO9]